MIVDGDSSARETLELNLLRMGIDTVTASTQQDAFSAISQSPISLCITEMQLSDCTGLDLIALMQTQTHTHIYCCCFQ